MSKNNLNNKIIIIAFIMFLCLIVLLFSIIFFIGSNNEVIEVTEVTEVTDKAYNTKNEIIEIELEDKYILSESNIRLLNYDDIKVLTEDDLDIAINEIYARHGRKFIEPTYKDYFENQNWYKGTVEGSEFDNKVFNVYELANIEFLVSLKEKVKSRVVLYEANYFDVRVFSGGAEFEELDEGKKYLGISISNITDSTFDFEIFEIEDNNGEKQVVFMKNTAIFTGNGNQAEFNGKEYNLKFTFPNERNSLPKVVQIKVDGFELADGVDFVFNGVPGHEFS